MSEWKEHRLGELVEVINGYAFKSSNFLEEQVSNSLPVIKIKNVANGDVHLNDCQFHIYDNTLKKFVVNKGDILLALTGNHPEVMTQIVGEASRFKHETKALLNQRVAKVIPSENINQGFLYYFLKEDSTHDYLASQSAGSANQANISKSDIENTPINLPPLTEQTAIASILSSLDDKIDLLHRQNKTLEQLAETIFRQWFVEEAEESSELGRIARITTGKGLKRNEFIEDGAYPILGANGEIGRTNHVLTDEKLILTGRVGTLGQVKISNGKVWISDNVLIINPEKEEYFYPIYFALKLVDFENLNSGSTQPLVTQTDLKTLVIPVSNNTILNYFNIHCKGYFEKINSNTLQIKTLTQLRDSLLPKLMSGEVRVRID